MFCVWGCDRLMTQLLQNTLLLLSVLWAQCKQCKLHYSHSFPFHIAVIVWRFVSCYSLGNISVRVKAFAEIKKIILASHCMLYGILELWQHAQQTKTYIPSTIQHINKHPHSHSHPILSTYTEEGRQLYMKSIFIAKSYLQ